MSASVEQLLAARANKDLLRFITCGSVDDGKSTLIGRLLFDAKHIYEDQLASVQRDSKKWGTTGEATDLALLVDGLQSEREQGITIDVAYRFFSTPQRTFIIADTPGHEQYTRNMATGASTADLAIILVDARKGLQTQTRRHSFICSLLGIEQIIVAVNKMDLIDYDQARYDAIVADYAELAQSLALPSVQTIPVSALVGDQIIERSAAMPWYQGPTLIELLEAAQPGDMGHPLKRQSTANGFRLPIQYVNRQRADFRGFAGTIASGHIAVGQAIEVLPSHRQSVVSQLFTPQGEVQQAGPGEAVTLTLMDEIDISRGDVLVQPDQDDRPQLTEAFDAHVVWMSDGQLLLGRQYDLKLATQSLAATPEHIHHRIDVNSLAQHPSDSLALNDIGLVRWRLNQVAAIDPYQHVPVMGSFIVIDRVSNLTVAAGMITRAVSGVLAEHDANVVWHEHRINKPQRARQKSQRPAVLWFTGLSGAGKSSLANALEQALFQRGYHSYLLDGDNVRHGLNRDLGFTDQDRVENIRRIGEVAKLMTDAGLVVLTAFISPFQADRQLVRSLMGEGEFVEIYVKASLAACEARDPKGLYKRARAGQIKHFTGIDSPYEPPIDPEVILDTETLSIEQGVDLLIQYLKKSSVLI